ncbi:MAG: ATP-binding protein [Gammaproteobacteria bacterium]
MNWGQDVLPQLQRNDLLEVMEDRHEHGATLITRQLSVSHLHVNIGNPPLADDILDRLLQNATRLQIKDNSMCKKQVEVDQA